MNFTYRNRRNAGLTAAYWNRPLEKFDWFEVKAQAGGDGEEIIIYDVIGWPFNDVNYLVRDIRGMRGRPITVRLNTPGGDVFDGIALFNAFRHHDAPVTMRIEGLAASIGSFLAMAGGKRQAYKNTMMMIHKAWVVAVGNEIELQEIADLLKKVDNNLRDGYVDGSKLGKKEVADMMAAETWLTAKEMLDEGLIDEIIEGKPIKAQFDLSIFDQTPGDLLGPSGEGGKILTEREIERALRDAGASRSFANVVVAGCRGNLKNQRDADDSVELLQSIINTMRKNNGT